MAANPTSDLFQSSLTSIFSEILDGPPGEVAYLLNPGDPGLLKQLESINAKTASTRPMPGKTTIAAHIDHVHYGLSLMNRWAGGEANVFETADWDASWKRGQVTPEQWKTLLNNLRIEAGAWQNVIQSRTEWDPITASGAIASAAHTAYHLGAIRQILAAQS